MTSSTIPGLLAVSPVGGQAGQSSAETQGEGVEAEGGPGGVENRPGHAPLCIVALDLSLSATGWAGYQLSDGREFGVIAGWPLSRAARHRERLTRIRHIRQRIDFTVVRANLVVVEGPAFSKGADPGAHERAGLWWAVYDDLTARGIPVVVIGTSQLKKYATGKGNAGKPEVVAAAIRRLGYDGHDDNVADALWMREMARAHYGEPHELMPAAHQVVLQKIDWHEWVTS